MQSYDTLRRLAHDGAISIRLSVEAEGLDEVEDLEAALSKDARQELEAEGLQLSGPLNLRTYSVGRSAEAYAVIVDLGGAVLMLLGAAKVIDEGWTTVQKWARALKRIRDKWRTARLSIEAIKVICLDDLRERYADATSPALDLVTYHVGGAPRGDGTWGFATPVYVSIPDEGRSCSHLYVVSASGEILHRVELPPFELEDPARRFQLAPASLLTDVKDPYPYEP